jgi:ABC-type proline/glycine betaine transport system substrate-binding protein
LLSFDGQYRYDNGAARSVTDWLRAEFDEECAEVVRALTGMVFSYDQNGHLLMRQNDIRVLVAAIDLLKRTKNAPAV